MTYREQYKNIIKVIVHRYGTKDKKRLIKKIDEVCPCNPEEYHQMKIWMEERKNAIEPNWKKKIKPRIYTDCCDKDRDVF